MRFLRTGYREKVCYRFGGARKCRHCGGNGRSIDAAAHWAALNAGGETIAILGNGIDVIYPSINTKLYMQLKERGCLISEFPLGAESLKHHFPRRNRLMSALGNGVVVVEGTRHSGVFHTVSHGLEQGKEIYAVPGSIFQGSSYAPHFLIKEGTAKLITVPTIFWKISWILRQSKK